MDVSLVSEIWEESENVNHKKSIEELLEIRGLRYISTSRPNGKRGGGVAIIVNEERFKVSKPGVKVPKGLEIVWALIKPKAENAAIKKIILCSFYSPPGSKLRISIDRSYCRNNVHVTLKIW